MERGGFSDAVRQEVSRSGLRGSDETGAELSAIARLAGVMTVSSSDEGLNVGVDITSASGAVARRVFALVQHRYGVRPELAVLAAKGVRRTIYSVRIGRGADHLLRDLEITDESGAPTDRVPANLDGPAKVAYLRGAVLATGSISAPGRAPHLELTASSTGVAAGLVELLASVLGAHAAVVEAERPRVVVKSGAKIGELLQAIGAQGAFGDWNESRTRRQVRAAANRLANADAANLRRSIDASRSQVINVETAIANVGWNGLEEDLRSVALVRLANPEASLAELGQLMDPPLGKSAVHRRLRRLEAYATEDTGEMSG